MCVCVVYTYIDMLDVAKVAFDSRSVEAAVLGKRSTTFTLKLHLQSPNKVQMPNNHLVNTILQN